MDVELLYHDICNDVHNDWSRYGFGFMDVLGRRPVPGSALPRHFKLVDIQPMRSTEKKKKRKHAAVKSTLEGGTSCKDDENQTPRQPKKSKENMLLDEKALPASILNVKENVQGEFCFRCICWCKSVFSVFLPAFTVDLLCLGLSNSKENTATMSNGKNIFLEGGFASASPGFGDGVSGRDSMAIFAMSSSDDARGNILKETDRFAKRIW